MARLILKWRYLKAGASGKHSENLIQYIARREGVEKIDDSWKHRPVTKAQKELIAQILSDYPDAKNSFEYQDYAKTHSAGAASESEPFSGAGLSPEARRRLFGDTRYARIPSW